jgi:hypothetical protein
MALILTVASNELLFNVAERARNDGPAFSSLPSGETW